MRPPTTLRVGEAVWPSSSSRRAFVDLFRHGYMLVDVTPARVQAEWYLLSSVLDAVADEVLAAAFQVRAGDGHLLTGDATSAALPGPAPAP
jgi:alkaline phosphatase D